MRYVICGNLASFSCRRLSRRILRRINLMFAVLVGNYSRNRFDACFWIHPGQAVGRQMAGESLQKRETSPKPSRVKAPPTCQNVTSCPRTLCVCGADCQQAQRRCSLREQTIWSEQVAQNPFICHEIVHQRGCRSADTCSGSGRKRVLPCRQITKLWGAEWAGQLTCAVRWLME